MVSLFRGKFGEGLQLRSAQVRVLGPIIGLALGSAALAAYLPGLAAAITLLLPLVVSLFAMPDLATLLVLIVLYSNAAVVATHFHGVPGFVAAAVPSLLLIPATKYLVLRRDRFVATSALPLMLVFLLIQLVGAALSSDPWVSIATTVTFAIEGLGLYLLLTNIIRTPATLRQAIWVLLLVGALIGALVMYQYMTGKTYKTFGGFAQMDGKIVSGEDVQLRVAGPIGEQNYYAQIMLILIPIGMFRFPVERRPWQRALIGISLFLITLGAALSFSRGGFVGFGLTLLLMVCMRYIRPYHVITALLALGLVIALVPEFGARLVSIQDLQSVTTGPGFDDEDTAVQGRLGEMLAAAKVFLDHPIVGVGPGMFKYYYQSYADDALRVHDEPRVAHDLYLGIAADNGALGLSCFLAIVFVTFRDLVRARRRLIVASPELANMAVGLMLAIVTYLTTGIFLYFAYVRYFWIMMALAGAVTAMAKRSSTEVTAGSEDARHRKTMVAVHASDGASPREPTALWTP